jgi:hypothetical protein
VDRNQYPVLVNTVINFGFRKLTCAFQFQSSFIPHFSGEIPVVFISFCFCCSSPKMGVFHKLNWYVFRCQSCGYNVQRLKTITWNLVHNKCNYQHIGRPTTIAAACCYYYYCLRILPINITESFSVPVRVRHDQSDTMWPLLFYSVYRCVRQNTNSAIHAASLTIGFLGLN